LALQFVLGRGKHQIERLTNREDETERLKKRLADNERRGEVSRCHQGGAAGVVAVVMGMRIVRVVRGGIRRIAPFTVSVFCGFSFWRMVAVMMSECRGSVCTRVVMIVAQQVFDAAIRRRQQPKPNTSRRSDAENERKLLLTVRHAFSPSSCHHDCHARTQESLLVQGLQVFVLSFGLLLAFG
jgi:hypothetical protein